jgi:Fe-S cluster assembly protein SufD
MTTEVKSYQDTYLQLYRRFEKRTAKDPEWLKTLRAEAIRSFADLGFPTTRLEDWKYTNVSAVAGGTFEPGTETLSREDAETLKSSPLFDLGCNRLVFVNGHFSKGLSSLDGLSPKIKVSSIAEAISSGAAPLQEHLGRYADNSKHGLVALNTAFISDGAYIEIPKGLVLDGPLQILHISTHASAPQISQTRVLIVAGQEAQAKIIEIFLGTGENANFTNAVTEIVAGENSTIDYVKVQHESAKAFHVATVIAHLARSANVATNTIDFGSRLGREDLITVLDGEGAESHLNGLYVTTGSQLIDNHTTIDHAKPHCASREFYKGVLDDKSTAVFNGKIIVRKDAQKTDSKQSDKNLLLSEDAVINTKPQLEIYADDVKCTHGATIGQIDAESIFYLRSRGIGLENARNLLIVAFANDIIDRIKHQPLRERLYAELLARLS